MVKLMCGLRTVLWMALVIGLSWFQVAWADLNDGLVAHYPFEGNANDESENGNHGTVYGATLTEDRLGNIDSAYSFDGTDDYIQIADTSNLDLSQEFTIQAWINPNSGYGVQQASHIDIVSKWGSGGIDNAAYLLGINNQGNILPWTYSGTAGSYFKGSQTVPINTWTHVLMARTRNTSKVYINGALDTSFDNAKLPQNSNYDLFIGQEPVGGNNFSGMIDDIRIYNRALSEDEIKALYEGVPADDGCKHATYSLKKRTLTVPFVEMPVVDFLSGQPTGKVELWTGSLKQIYGTTNRFRLLSKTVAQITDGSSSSCPATYAVETGTLSIPYIDIPTGITVGNKNFENEVDVFKATMTWEPMGRSFVVQEVEQLP
jgi:hypothetical protein